MKKFVRNRIAWSVLILVLLLVADSRAADPLRIAYEGDLLPDLASPTWLVSTSIVRDDLVSDPLADGGTAYELETSGSGANSINPDALLPLDNSIGWVLEIGHLAISNSGGSLVNDEANDDSDHLRFTDGHLILFVDFRPTEVRVSSDSFTGRCDSLPEFCHVWDVPRDEYVLLTIAAQGNSFRVSIEGQDDFVGQRSAEPAAEPFLAFGNGSASQPKQSLARWDYIRLTMTGPFLNSAPIADAGDDLTIECGDLDATPVSLSGLLSTDPDGDALTFTWRGPFIEGGGTVTGGLPTVTLPLGTHVIALTVMDPLGEMSTDDVTVTVIDTTAPTVTAALQPRGKRNDDGSSERKGKDHASDKSGDDRSGFRSHRFEVVARATDSCDPSPNIVAEINGHSVLHGQRVIIKLGGGKDRVRMKKGVLEFHTRRATLTVIATDSAGNSATEQVVLAKSEGRGSSEGSSSSP